MTESKARAALREFVSNGGPPAAASPAEAARLAAEAQAQGLAELLLGALEREPGSVPGPLVSLLARRRAERLAVAVGQAAFAARTIDLLAEAGIRALPLKGTALAQTVYDLESERPMLDVDLLTLERWEEATRLLVARGLEPAARADHACVLRERRSGRLLELHRSLTSAPGLFIVDAPGLWERRRAGRGLLRFVPSAEDLLVQLALHAAFQHALVLPLVQWLDFRRLLEREPLQLEALALAAERARAEVPLAAALLAARAVAGAPLDERAVERALQTLPRGLRRWLEPRLISPLRLVEGAPVALSRVRWELLAGRRTALVRRTLLLPETPGGARGLPARLAHALSRATKLARLTLTRAAPPPSDAPPGTDADADAGTDAGAHAGTDTDTDTPEQALVRDCLASFPTVAFTVGGGCMEPAIRAGERVRLVSPERRRPRVGDVVLVRRGDTLRLHRLVWAPRLRSSAWRTRADRGLLLDPPFASSDLLATVVAVEGRPDARARNRPRALASLVDGVVAGIRWRRSRREDAAAPPSCSPRDPAPAPAAPAAR